MPQPLIEFYTSVMTKNWFATAALAIMIGTQLLNSLPWLRAKIWVKIPTGYRWGVPVLAASLTAFVHGFTAHETLTASIWDTLKIALSAMGGAAALKESPLPWGGGAGGVAVTPAPVPSPAAPLPSPLTPTIAPSLTPPLPFIPPLADATDDDKTPVDGQKLPPPSDPPPTAA